MPIFAPKIFSNDPIELQQRVLASRTHKDDGLELALYGYKHFPDVVEDAIREISNTSKILHLWQQRVSFKGLIDNCSQTKKNLDFELEHCKNMDVRRVVIHHNFASTIRYIDNVEEYAQQTIKHFEYAHNQNVIIHAENVFKPFQFFERFYAELDRLGALEITGLCLDTGHARLYNGVDLETWLDFIIQIHARGAHIHYHIHANDGSDDQHMTLSKAHTEGLLEPIDGWTPKGYLSWLKRAIAATPRAIFCQEHPAQESSEAMAFIRLLQEDGVL